MVGNLVFRSDRSFLLVLGVVCFLLLFATVSCDIFGDEPEDDRRRMGQTCNAWGRFVNTAAKCKEVMFRNENQCDDYRFWPNGSYPDPQCKGYYCLEGCWAPELTLD